MALKKRHDDKKVYQRINTNYKTISIELW